MSSKQLSIGIAGATGLIGNELLVVLDQLKIPFSEVSLFASKESVGEFYKVRGEEVTVDLLDDNWCEGIDIAFIALPPEIAGKEVQRAKEKCSLVIDCSRGVHGEGPLVVAGTGAPPPMKGVVSTACPAVVALAPVLSELHQKAGLKRVVVSTYQSCASAGKAALDELWEQTLSIFNQKQMPHEAFQYQIAFNAIPQIDIIHADGSSREETRIAEELKVVLGLPKLGVAVTAVRVPLFHADAFSVNVELEKPLSATAAKDILSARSDFTVFKEHDEFPLPVDVASSDEIQIGRIREDSSVPHGLSLWVVSDALRRGIALNAVGILRTVLEVQ